MRGGAINWGNIGSRLSSALSNTGRWLYNAGNKFIHSNTFNQIKQGIKDSGVIQNVANLAGETLSSLTDIGRLKLQQDIERLRRKALGEDGGNVSQAELAALLSALQGQVGPSTGPQVLPSTEANPGPAVPAPFVPPTAPPPPPPSAPLVPMTRPMPGMETPVLPPITSSAPAVPTDTPTTLEYLPPRDKRRRKRPASGTWRTKLNSITGSGVSTKSRRMCY